LRILMGCFMAHVGRASAIVLVLVLSPVIDAVAQTQAEVDKARREWEIPDAERKAMRRRSLALQEDWSRGMWVVRNANFFSSYTSVDDYLSGRAVPDAAPLTPEFQAKAAALREAGKKDRAAVDTGQFVQHLMTMGASFNDDPDFVPLKPFTVVCPLYGYSLALIQPNPMRWEFAPTKIFQVWNGEGGISRLIKAGVSNDGFKGKFRFPGNTVHDGMGWALAYWEGEVLTIETSYVAWYYENESGYVMEIGIPHSDKMSAVERWRQTGPDTLELELTITDPVALTRPWTVKKVYDRRMGIEIVDRQCH
jgi:hypothetical protein